MLIFFYFDTGQKGLRCDAMRFANGCERYVVAQGEVTTVGVQVRQGMDGKDEWCAEGLPSLAGQ